MTTGLFGLAAAFAAVVLAAAARPADAAPERIISLNVCADQLVLALADASQIAGLSRFARDPRLSAMADQARAFPVAGGSAEEAVALGADLVIVGPFDRAATERLLRLRGIAVERMGFATSLAGAEAEIARFARLVGHPDRGDALIARIRESIRRPVAQGPTATALPYQRRGYASGPETMIGDAIRLSGFRHAMGATGAGGFLGLERLIAIRPDILVTGETDGAPDQGSALMAHRALDRIMPTMNRVTVADPLTDCPGPGLAEALRLLSAVPGRDITHDQQSGTRR